MKISVDDQEFFTLSDHHKKVIQNDIPSEIFDEDMKRRLKWAIMEEKYSRCMQALREQWESKFKAEGVAMLPTDDEAFAQMVFAHPNYKNRSQREAERNV